VETLFQVRAPFTESASIAVHSTAVANQLYRIAQEAMSNALRHAQPTVVEVTVRVGNFGGSASRRQLQLVIWNDCPEREHPISQEHGGSESDGMGLEGMQIRCAAIGATVEINRDFRTGYEVKVTLPAGAAWAEVEATPT
jgi:signal transduction histidine kinase